MFFKVKNSTNILWVAAKNWIQNSDESGFMIRNRCKIEEVFASFISVHALFLSKNHQNVQIFLFQIAFNAFSTQSFAQSQAIPKLEFWKSSRITTYFGREPNRS